MKPSLPSSGWVDLAGHYSGSRGLLPALTTQQALNALHRVLKARRIALVRRFIGAIGLIVAANLPQMQKGYIYRRMVSGQRHA